MPGLLTIGDFAKVTFLNVKTLRHYHDIGLLPAAEVDPSSGYRRYSIEQAPEAQVIRRLRDLGMPLEEVAEVLRAPDVPSRNAAISAHLRRMEDQLTQTRAAVASLRGLLDPQSEQVEVSFRTYPPMHALAIQAEVDDEDVWPWRLEAFQELRSTLAGRLDLRRAGSDTALYSPELFERDHGPITAFIPIESLGDAPAELSGRGRITEVPAAEYALAWHAGDLNDLDKTFAALGKEVTRLAISIPGAVREIYDVSILDTDDVDLWRTGIHWPVFQTGTTR